MTDPGHKLLCADCLDWLREQPSGSVDLVFGSPPYEGQREYDELEFNLRGDDWVEWAMPRFVECLRVCRGLVAWVIEGATTDFRYSATPFLLAADLHRAGFHLRKPCVYWRQGIPGSGGPDWLRNDWEPVVCATKGGRLPWSEATATGTKPVSYPRRYATRRGKDGDRQNAGAKNMERDDVQWYTDPEVANPGNVLAGSVGHGHLGWEDAHKNEAPFPEWLAEFFVRSFCPPGGVVLDPFCGSGTTLAVAQRHGRGGIGLDIRESQVALSQVRLNGLTVAEANEGQKTLFDARNTKTR